MASSLFAPGKRNPQQQGNGGIFSSMVKTLVDTKYDSDPRFREFVDNVIGKSPQQVCQEYGTDYDEAKSKFSDIFTKYRNS